MSFASEYFELLSRVKTSALKAAGGNPPSAGDALDKAPVGDGVVRHDAGLDAFKSEADVAAALVADTADQPRRPADEYNPGSDVKLDPGPVLWFDMGAILNPRHLSTTVSENAQRKDDESHPGSVPQMNTIDKIIEDVLEREGPGDPAKGYLSPGDKGGRTNWGISERAHPEEWANGKVPSRERAAEIYRSIYVYPWEWLPENSPLFEQLVDCCVLHGEPRTWKLLKKSISLAPETPRIETVAYARTVPSNLLNQALVAQRLKFIDEINNPTFDRGWRKRALSFL